MSRESMGVRYRGFVVTVATEGTGYVGKWACSLGLSGKLQIPEPSREEAIKSTRFILDLRTEMEAEAVLTKSAALAKEKRKQ